MCFVTSASQGCVLSQVLPRGVFCHRCSPWVCFVSDAPQGCVLSQMLPRGVFCHKCSPGVCFVTSAPHGCVLSQVLPRGVFCPRCSPGVCFVTGAPQGCVLSPLLFSVYINCNNSVLKLIKYADDYELLNPFCFGAQYTYYIYILYFYIHV